MRVGSKDSIGVLLEVYLSETLLILVRCILYMKLKWMTASHSIAAGI